MHGSSVLEVFWAGLDNVVPRLRLEVVGIDPKWGLTSDPTPFGVGLIIRDDLEAEDRHLSSPSNRRSEA